MKRKAHKQNNKSENFVFIKPGKLRVKAKSFKLREEDINPPK